MVQGVMLLLMVVWIGTMYKWLGRNIDDNWNGSIFSKNGFKEGNKSYSLWRKDCGAASKIGKHRRENVIWVLHGKGIFECISNYSFHFDFYEHLVYGKQN